MKTADEFIQRIAQSISNAELILFCGGGISCNSGIPMVSPLVNYILDKLQISEHEKKLFRKSNLPFEAFMEVLRGNITVDKIFDIYDADKPTLNAVKPNSNHFLLAKLVKSGKLKTIVTTNFDRLIEKALSSGPNPWQENREYDVLYCERDFKNIDWNNNRIRLIKIHGSIHDKKNMAITMKQVANKKFSSLKKNVVDYVFSNGSHKSVLILGYSCSDAFDISPQIEAIKSSTKNVFLVDHITDGSPRVEPIKTKKDKNPFKGFVGNRVFLNTDTLVKSLWKEVFKECREAEMMIIPWEKNVDDWCFGVPALNKSKIAGLIFWAISKYGISIHHYDKGITIARDTKDKKGEGRLLGNLGNAYYRLNQHSKAISYHTKALEIARAPDITDIEGEGKHLDNLGNVYYALKEYKKARIYYEEALEIARALTGKHGEETRLGNLGNAYCALGDYNKAIYCHRQALEIARAPDGDIEGQGRHLGNLGNAYYCKANDYYTQSLLILEPLLVNKHPHVKFFRGMLKRTDTKRLQKLIDHAINRAETIQCLSTCSRKFWLLLRRGMSLGRRSGALRT